MMKDLVSSGIPSLSYCNAINSVVVGGLHA